MMSNGTLYKRQLFIFRGGEISEDVEKVEGVMPGNSRV